MNETTQRRSLLEGVTGYHWLVLIVASCGWLFDCMDQRIFVLARSYAAGDLVGAEAASKMAQDYGSYATAAMMLGWATGGIIFGIISDRVGRVKTMIMTLFVYSAFTGLSSLSVSWVDFTLYRFLTGLGIGGQFAAAATLVGETVPEHVRSLALGSLQALSAMGNVLGSAISFWIPPSYLFSIYDYNIPGWRLIFLVGVLPALLAIIMFTKLREPEKWKQAKAAAAKGDVRRQLGSFKDLFRENPWRRNTFVGVTLALAGVIGLWGIGFYSPELVGEALKGEPTEEIQWVQSFGTMIQDVGAFFGMFAFTLIATFVGRRVAFLLSFALGLVVVASVFYFLDSAADAYWMLPLLGFATLTVFGGYSIYFPELYPTRLRSTGTGFNYNVGRYLAAPGPILFAQLRGLLEGFGFESPFRVAAVMMASIYILGMIALIWAPETKGKPLPEEEPTTAQQE